MAARQLVFVGIALAVTVGARQKNVSPFDNIWRVMPTSPGVDLSLAQRFGCGTVPKILMDSCISEIDPALISLSCLDCLLKAINGGDKAVRLSNVAAIQCVVRKSGTGPGECAQFKECVKKCSTRVCSAACCRLAQECSKRACALRRICMRPFLAQTARMYLGPCSPFCVAGG